MDNNSTNLEQYKLDQINQVELTPSIIDELRFNEEQEINREIDSIIQQKPNSFPKAVPFVTINEFGERFCYNGIKPLVFLFLARVAGLKKESAKTQFHVWVSLTNLFPLIGAALSDSYFGKYNTIVVMSIIYLVGTSLLSVFSINDLLWDYTQSEDNFPLWTILFSLYLIGIGTGGIKPCIASHGGDQFPPSHYHLLSRFFLFFFWAANIGSMFAGILSPIIKDNITCFGTKCYFASFGLCAIVLAISLTFFIFGSPFYRVIPPPKEFLPWKAIKTAISARKLWSKAPANEKELYGHWLNFADDLVGAHFTEEIRLLGKVIVMFVPFIFFFILFDQYNSEWQHQIEFMDRRIGTNLTFSTELSNYFNTILIMFLIPLFNYIIYPYLRKKNISFKLLDRMGLGYLLVLIAFIISNILQYQVDYYYNNVSHSIVPVADLEVTSCDGCLTWVWQIPQWIILSLGEALVMPTAFEFAYSQVGTQMKASSSSLWLLSSALGNIIVSILEAILQQVDLYIRLWLYVGLSAFGFIVFLLLKRYYYVYKEDEMEIYDDGEETFSPSNNDLSQS
ncbi:PTR2-domain-containing protein [Neoconidiobolus thromboides FSU 785]|nr:PTR2-domain-containing protein [Neoconidiobolus thromboides FSU 785]